MRYILILLFSAVAATAAEHPHLLFSGSDIPALQAKIKAGGVPARAYAQLLNRCGQHSKLKAVSGAPVKGQISDLKLDPLSELALAWQLSGRPELLASLERLLTDARQKRIDLIKAGYHVPFIFDWGYAGLGAESRQYLKEQIVKEIRTNPKMKRFPAFGIFGNWGYFMYMPFSIRYLAVLAGHPEFDRSALDRAAKAMKIMLDHAVVPGGAVTEHGAYTNYPFTLNGSAILMLERKGYRTVKGTNLNRIGEWMLLETTAGPPPRFLPLADCNLQEPALYMLRLLAALMPESPAVAELLERCGAEKEVSPDPLSGIVYYRPPTKTASPANFPNWAFYPEMNLLLYRSDWSEKALQFASEAIVSRGHSHSDVGSFLLGADGVLRVTEPGYGIKSGLQHNIVTIDGTAPSEHGGSGQVDAQITTPFAVLFSVDAFDAWNRSTAYALRWKHHGRVERADRSFAVLPPDPAHGVPGYLVIADSVKALRPDAQYEFRLQQDPFSTIRLERDTAQITLPTAFPVPLKKQSVQLKTAADGEYNLYLLAAGKSSVKVRIDGKEMPPVWFTTSLPYRFSWQAVAKKVALSAGNHTLEITAESGLNAARLCAAARPPEFGTASETGVSLTDRTAQTTVWIPQPQPVKLKTVDVKNKADYQNLRTLIAESASGNFLSVILPDKLQPVRKAIGNWYGFTHALEWKQTVDFLAIGREPKSDASPLEPRLKMIRISRKDRARFPKQLPDDLRYLLAKGGDLKVGNVVLFEACEAGGDRQMITYPRVAVEAWAVLDGETLRTELRLERRSGAFLRKINVKAFAPKVKKVYCNDREVKFTRNGRYVNFTALPEAHRQAGSWQKEESFRFTETF